MKKKDDLRDRLFKVTSDFSGPQIEDPFPSLEHWEHESTEEREPNSLGKREHSRKDNALYGIFKTKYEQFRASTKNVSEGGVLIDPEIDLSFNEYVYMTFFHRKFNIPVHTNGKIVRVDSDGVGIQFDQAIPVMSSV